MVSLQNVEKYYNKGKSNEVHAIKNTTLELPEHGVVALFGKSGCGKTTLLNAIGGTFPIDSGKILVHGEDISRKTDIVRNRYIGYVFQDYCLCSGETVFDNVADALRLAGVRDAKEIERRVKAALRNVGMDKYARRHPNSLSGGQQQRVALARAIVKNPKVILADEPTGNLDEENTELIMELLRQLGEDHLVLLVTHEAELVERYCDTVVNIVDGAIVNIRETVDVDVVERRDDNTIYLGDMQKVETATEFGKTVYYGELPSEPFELSLICHEGKVYLKTNAVQVQLLGENSKLVVEEGSRELTKTVKSSVARERMALEPLSQDAGRRVGRLFGLKDSLASGWDAVVNSKRKNKLLCISLFLFAVIMVFLTALYGTGIENVLEARNKNSETVFYAYVPNIQKAQELLSAVGREETGIDSVDFKEMMYARDEEFYLDIPLFETVGPYAWDNALDAAFHGVVFSEERMQDAKLVCGKKDDLGRNEAVITTAVAEAIIADSRLSFIDDYETILGFYAMSVNKHKQVRIVGIVESDDRAIYINKYDMAKRRYDEKNFSELLTGTECAVPVEKGSVIIRLNQEDGILIPTAGETVVLNGVTLDVADVINVRYTYEDWLADNEIVKLQQEESTSEVYEYYNYYYAEYLDYVDYCRTNKTTVEYSPIKELAWNGSTEAWYVLVMELCNDPEYYYASSFKKEHGYYPDEKELEEAYFDYVDPYTVLEKQLADIDELIMGDHTYILHEDDYIACSKSFGETKGFLLNEEKLIDAYAVIHSVDVKATERYVIEQFSDVWSWDDGTEAYTTPRMLMQSHLEFYKAELRTAIMVWSIFAIVMCLCIYMIMSSNLMKRAREIGIYRCIGVTRKNVLFRFGVETLVMLVCTLGSGYLLASGIVWLLGSGHFSYMMKGVIFYPVWLGLLLLAFLLLITMLCGMLPVILLLRKSPKDIRVQYDN